MYYPVCQIPRTYDIGYGTSNIKNCKSEFKRLIKVWKPETCPCRICKRYVPNIGFN